MQKLFQETLSLDVMAREKYGLSEEIMMENAARAIAEFIRSSAVQSQIHKKHDEKCKIIIFCGGGNNGADGYAVGRMLAADYEVSLYELLPAKSALAKLQKERAIKVGLHCLDFSEESLESCLFDGDIYIDAILGASQKGDLSPLLQQVINRVNELHGMKIACDLPTGMGNTPFRADFTITMGALKIGLLTDKMKDYVGEILVADLGIARQLYETESDVFLLEAQDLKLPFREIHDSHKGNYGFVSIIKGEQSGASLLSAKAAMRFGAGITALVGEGEKPLEIMQMPEISPKTTAIAVGMGLGNREVDLALFQEYPLLIDADLLGKEAILPLLVQKEDCVITPHPEEFRRLLSISGIGEYSISEIQDHRFELAQLFSQKYKVVLVLKGANTIIAQAGKCYVSALGTNHLAKGGSGDVLAGMITALLAQGMPALDAAIQGVLAHSMAARSLKMNDYAMTPLDLIDALKYLSRSQIS